MDVIRGTSSALYGSGSLGGIINVVSKTPRADQKNEINIQTGSYSRIQGAADIGGALNHSKTLLWRFNGLIRKSGTSFKNIKNNEIFVAPSLRWIVNPDTDLTLLANFVQIDAGSSSQFLPAVGTVEYNKYGKIARNFLNSDEDYDVYSKRQVSVGYSFRHSFAPNWTLTQNMRFSHIDLLYRYVTATSFSANERTLSRQALLQSSNYNNVTLDTHLEGLFRTGAIHHDLLGGVDFRSDFIALRRGQKTASSLDVFNPVYTTISWPVYASKINTNETEFQTGLYLQDQVSWRKFHLILSGREDFTNSLTADNIAYTKTSQNNKAFTGRVGLIYTSDIGISPYVSYSTAFQPEVGVTRTGSPYVPITGKQIEVGVKYKPAHTDLLLTADVFNLVEQNALTTDPTDSTYDVQTGAQRTRGLELEALGTLPYQVRVIGSFTYQEPIITSTTVAGEHGDRPTGIPMRMASVYLDRNFQITRSFVAGIGSGLRYNGNTEGSLSNTFLVPSQLVWDLQAHADYQHYRIQVNGTNMTDRRYVAVCTRNVACSYASGRAVFATLSYRW